MWKDKSKAKNTSGHVVVWCDLDTAEAALLELYSCILSRVFFFFQQQPLRKTQIQPCSLLPTKTIVLAFVGAADTGKREILRASGSSRNALYPTISKQCSSSRGHGSWEESQSFIEDLIQPVRLMRDEYNQPVSK